MVQFSDPLRRKTYEPKVLVHENKKDGDKIISDKISQISLNFRKEATLNLKQENGSQDQMNVIETGYSFERSSVSYNFLSKSIFAVWYFLFFCSL